MNVTWPEYRDAWNYADDEAGIRAAQADLGVPVTGVWDDLTARTAIRTPRCGCQDSQNLGESRWDVDKLQAVRWFMQSGPGGLSDSRATEIYRQAFLSWTKVCGIRFEQVNSANQANILIGAGRGRRVNLDGPGGTLAWAYLPSGSRFTGQLQVMFDLDEYWTDNQQANGTLLLNVAAHEFGHAIGLSHNNVQRQLLNPIYNRAIAVPQSYDISQVVQLYGQPAAQPAPTPADPKPAGLPQAVRILLADGSVAYADNFRILTPGQLQSMEAA